MTERNIFDELQEDFERQRLENLWKKYAPAVIAAALAIVIATAGMSAWRTWKTDRDQKLTNAYIDAAQEDQDAAKSVDLLQKFAAAHPGTDLGAFALLRAGAQQAEQGDAAKAAASFDAVANDAKADPAFRQLGTLLSVRAQMDTGDAAALSARLDPLTADGAPWRYSALEAQAYLALRAGDTAKAKKIFTDLSQDARVPQDIAARAGDIVRSFH
ncbi:MAG: tetratricopeptide repeat protein [Alphaproteobacteria bacterium]|nr:tetratricopeptide repeat protein [Alphaproteobacteria bacterium]